MALRNQIVVSQFGGLHITMVMTVPARSFILGGGGRRERGEGREGGRGREIATQVLSYT